jgi:CHAD domain-containing protein
MFALRGDERVPVGLARIMGEQVDLAMWQIGLIGESDTHVHEVRKATKRLRAVLRLVREDVGRDAYNDVNVIVRDIARELSQARSAVVQVSLLESMVEGDRDLLASTSVLHSDLAAEADRRRALLVDPLVKDLTERFDAARAGIEHFELGPDAMSLEKGVRRTYRRGRRAMARAYETGSPLDFHMWRKQVKYLRHQMEVLEGVNPVLVDGLVADLERIGEALGADNDLTDLATAALERQGSQDQRVLLDLIATERDQIETGLKLVAAQAYERSPREFARQVVGSLA